MTGTTRADAVLEELSLERRPASARFFEELFLRFQRRVAFETLTRPAADPGAFDAEAFFARFGEEEMGLVGEERALAFAWLAEDCGFEVSLAGGTCRRPWEEAPERVQHPLSQGVRAHRGVVARVDGRGILADAGFPLPVLLPLDPPAAAIPTSLGELSVNASGEGGRVVVTCDARGRETELLRLGPAPDGAHGSADAFALRVLDDRILFWRAGRMTILDPWSRLEYPLPARERAAIEKLFALELEGIALPEDPPDGAKEPGTLAVFHLSPAAPDEARARVGRDALPLILVSSRKETVEAAPGGSLVTIRATLADVPPEGPGEAVRKTLVFHLVSELFGLSRGEAGAG